MLVLLTIQDNDLIVLTGNSGEVDADMTGPGFWVGRLSDDSAISELPASDAVVPGIGTGESAHVC